jgi:hypothetical protein
MNHSKEIRTYDAGDAADLLCPRCGADDLHHVGAIFYERGEDGADVLQLTQTLRRYGEDRATGMVTEIVPSDRARNPSSRRSGMAILFECEQCGGGTDADRIELTIAQHKGSTEVGWRFTPKAKTP